MIRYCEEQLIAAGFKNEHKHSSYFSEDIDFINYLNIKHIYPLFYILSEYKR